MLSGSRYVEGSYHYMKNIPVKRGNRTAFWALNWDLGSWEYQQDYLLKLP